MSFQNSFFEVSNFLQIQFSEKSMFVEMFISSTKNFVWAIKLHILTTNVFTQKGEGAWLFSVAKGDSQSVYLLFMERKNIQVLYKLLKS